MAWGRVFKVLFYLYSTNENAEMVKTEDKPQKRNNKKSNKNKKNKNKHQKLD